MLPSTSLLALLIILLLARSLHAWQGILAVFGILIGEQVGVSAPLILTSPFLPPPLTFILAILMLARMIFILLRPKHHAGELAVLTLALSMLIPSLREALLLLALLSLAFQARLGIILSIILLPSMILFPLTFHIIPPVFPLLFLLSLPGFWRLIQQRQTPLAGFLLALLLTQPSTALIAYLPLLSASYESIRSFITRTWLAPFTRFILYVFLLTSILIPLMPLLIILLSG